MYQVLLFFLLVFSIAFFYLNTMTEPFTTDFKEILPIQIGGDNKSIQVPSNIQGIVEKHISFGGDVRIPKFSVLEFAPEAIKDKDAGKIGYMTFGDQLCIVGATPTDKKSMENDRKVKIWDVLEVNNNLKVNEYIECKTLNITSDERIKHKKTVLDATASLEKVRALTPSTFEFKNGTQPVHGFIAQEVQKVLPTCVSSQKSYISNIHDTATRKGNLLTFKQFHTSNLATKEGTLYPNLQLRTKHGDQPVKILRIVDEHTVELDSYTQKDEVLVYGQEVDDFLTIDKNQLFTLTTSALQALDHRQQALDHRQQALDHRQQALDHQQQALDQQVEGLLQQLQEERDAYKTTLHRMLQRLSALEAKEPKE